MDEIRTLTKRYISGKWEDRWREGEKGRFFYEIKKKRGKLNVNKDWGRTLITKVLRLRSGQTCFSTLFRQCECGNRRSVQHILYECNEENIRERRLALGKSFEDLGLSSEPADLLNLNMEKAQLVGLLKFLAPLWKMI